MQLADWLARIESLHPRAWDLGLERVAEVARRLELTKPAGRTFLVAGTNGKGSICAYIDALCRAMNLSSGVTTSPHLLRFNERILVNGKQASDAAICDAFQTIDDTRGDISLTYFEFAALAAMLIFRRQQVDVAVLEVGLGGRLDAMNLVDPDVSVISRIALDHQSWLGDSREAIAVEKAGVMRFGRPCVLGDEDMPASLYQCAQDTGCRLLVPGTDYGYRDPSTLAVDRGGVEVLHTDLPQPQLPAASAAAAVQAVFCADLCPDRHQIATVLSATTLPGRCQVVEGERKTLVDVAHNPDAAAWLASRLADMKFSRCHAVAGMYEDKDYGRVLALLSPMVSHWYFADLAEPRGAPAAALAAQVTGGGCEIGTYGKVCEAYEDAIRQSTREDLILVFGSFPAVADVLKFLQVPV